jgi:hypothetical protein
VFEDKLAGEEDTVREVLPDPLSKLRQLLDGVDITEQVSGKVLKGIQLAPPTNVGNWSRPETSARPAVVRGSRTRPELIGRQLLSNKSLIAQIILGKFDT